MQSTNWIEPEKITAGHAWRRWAARLFDGCLFSYLLPIFITIIPLLIVKMGYNIAIEGLSLKDLFNFFTSFFSKDNIGRSELDFFVGRSIRYFIFSFFSLLLKGLFIAGFTACFRNTPGKYLFGIKIRHISGRSINLQEAFKRETLVFLKGLGLGIPIVNLVTESRAYDELLENKITTWDKQLHLRVSYRTQLGWLKLLSIIMLIGLFCIGFLVIFLVGIDAVMPLTKVG